MVKYNFWDRFYGERPKTFKKESTEHIRNNTLYYLQKYGRSRWIKTEEIFEGTLEKTDLFNSEKGKMFFAVQGIKSKISSATHKLRLLGNPIISGIGGKGYRYADESCDDFIDVWDEKFSAFERRKTSLEKEAENDKKLMERIILNLKEQGREKEAEQMQEILVKYAKKN